MRREGRKGKSGGVGDDPIVVPRMPMMVMEGYCFLPMTSLGT